MKGLTFHILWGFFQCFDDLMPQLKHTENNYRHYFLNLLLLFYFSTIKENLYMICHFSNLFFEDGNEINQYYDEQTCFFH